MSLIQKNRIALLFVVLSLNLTSLIAAAKIETVIGSVALQSNDNLAGILPTTSQSEIIISRPQYVISYNKDRRTPNWVAWKLEADQLGTVGRSNNFMQDPDLETYLGRSGQHAVDPDEYKNSCFDRGHQIPSGDRTDSAANNEATFMMSNMIPQTAYLNRVIWEHLEQYTRDLVRKQNKKVYVIAGPVYDENFGAIGPHQDIQVPSKDFKIIIVLDANQTAADITTSTPVIAVIMPNTTKDGSKPAILKSQACGNDESVDAVDADTNDWQQYETTVAQIESISGIKLAAMQPSRRKK